MNSFKIKRIISRIAFFILILAIVIFVAIVAWLYFSKIRNSQGNLQNDLTYEPIDPVTVTAINSRILTYKGKIDGKEVKELIRKVEEINKEFDIPHQIVCSINYYKVRENIAYDVSFKYEQSGCISEVVIVED